MKLIKKKQEDAFRNMIIEIKKGGEIKKDDQDPKQVEL